MMNIVEFTNGRVTSHDHLAISVQSQTVEPIRIESLRLGIHGITPRPECILFRERAMCMASQGTLKNMAMHVDETWKECNVTQIFDRLICRGPIHCVLSLSW